MFSSLRLSTLVIAGLTVGAYGFAQAENDRNATNGTDIIFYYNDPSVGAASGSTNPMTTGDLYWVVYAKAQEVSASGSVEVSGLNLELYDTDWNTSADFYDTLFTKGLATPQLANHGEPDFNDANGVLLLLGNSGFANPCSVSPALCSGGTCPPPGFVVGYLVDIGLGTCAADGIVLVANGTQDNIATSFAPGGMCLATCAPGVGACGQGDFSFQGAASTDEAQSDHFATGYSHEGGFQGGPNPGGPVFNADGLNERSSTGFQFCQIALAARVSDAGGVGGLSSGLAGWHLSVSGGASKFGYEVYDLNGIGNLMFAASCLLPLFPAPGIPLFGAGVLLNLTDPTVNATLRKGTVVLQNNGGAPFDNGIFQSGSLVTVPAGAVGLTLHSQAISLKISTLTATGSPAIDTNFDS